MQWYAVKVQFLVALASIVSVHLHVLRCFRCSRSVATQPY